MNYVTLGLSFIIVGNGLFKPAPTALISKVFNYSPSQSHSAFTLYYMGVNIGSFLATLFTPIIAKYTNYSVAFLISAIGMILALTNYFWRAKILEGISVNIQVSLITKIYVALGCLAQLIICYLLFQFSDISLYLIIAVCLITFAYMLRDASLNSDKKVKLLQFFGIVLVIEAIVFFIVYNQMFSTLVLFAKHNVDLKLLGVSVSPATYTALNPFWLILMSPILAYLYKRGSSSHLATPYKYSIGTILAGIAPLVLYTAIINTASSGVISGNWMFIYFFFGSVAELLVAALGFSLIAIYFRKEIVTFGMGFFMLAVALGGALSGKLGQLVASPR